MTQLDRLLKIVAGVFKVGLVLPFVLVGVFIAATVSALSKHKA